MNFENYSSRTQELTQDQQMEFISKVMEFESMLEEQPIIQGEITDQFVPGGDEIKINYKTESKEWLTTKNGLYIKLGYDQTQINDPNSKHLSKTWSVSIMEPIAAHDKTHFSIVRAYGVTQTDDEPMHTIYTDHLQMKHIGEAEWRQVPVELFKQSEESDSETGYDDLTDIDRTRELAKRMIDFVEFNKIVAVEKNQFDQDKFETVMELLNSFDKPVE